MNYVRASRKDYSGKTLILKNCSSLLELAIAEAATGGWSVRKGALRNFAKFTKERDSDTGVFLWILQNF